jgi:hypothetical protein
MLIIDFLNDPQLQSADPDERMCCAAEIRYLEKEVDYIQAKLDFLHYVRSKILS